MNIWQSRHLKKKHNFYIYIYIYSSPVVTSIYCASVWSVQPSPLISHLPDPSSTLLMAKEKSYLCSLCRNKYWWWLQTSRHEVVYTRQPPSHSNQRQTDNFGPSGTDGTLCAPGAGRGERCSHRRLSQTWLWVSKRLQWRLGWKVWPQAKQQGGSTAPAINRKLD